MGRRSGSPSSNYPAEDNQLYAYLPAAHSSYAQLGIPILHQPRSTQFRRKGYVLVCRCRAFHLDWPLFLSTGDQEQNQYRYRHSIRGEDTGKEVQSVRSHRWLGRKEGAGNRSR